MRKENGSTLCNYDYDIGYFKNIDGKSSTRCVCVFFSFLLMGWEIQIIIKEHNFCLMPDIRSTHLRKYSRLIAYQYINLNIVLLI